MQQLLAAIYLQVRPIVDVGSISMSATDLLIT